jgi:hypothetical protein
MQPPAPPSPAAIASEPLPLLLVPLLPPLPLLLAPPELLALETPPSTPVLLLLEPPHAAPSVTPKHIAKKKGCAFFIRLISTNWFSIGAGAGLRCPERKEMRQLEDDPAPGASEDRTDRRASSPTPSPRTESASVAGTALT